MSEEGVQKLLNEPFPVQFVLFFVFSLFCMVAVAVFVSAVFSIRLDKHLKNHHFQAWKLKRGTYQERLNNVIPKDTFYIKETRLHDRIHRWIMFVWFVVLVIAIIILYVKKAIKCL